jgi:hypothetical protein
MPNPCPLKELQKRFCIIDMHGEFMLFDKEKIEEAKSVNYTGDISFYKKSHAELNMRRYLETLPINSKPKEVIASFWNNPTTKVYKQTAFTPNTTKPDTLNYWVPHTIKPFQNDFKIIERYLLKVICDDNETSYAYLTKFLAHMLQSPIEKPGVVPVLIGGQGTGKGVFFQLLKAIWSKTTLLVSNIDEVVGKFNAALERNYVVCMDEALFSGDRKSLDRLKSTVTESTIRIEQKFLPSRTIESVHRFFAATNHDHFAHIDNDDRRFFFLRVSSSHQQDSKYFSELCDSFSDGKTLEGFVDYLLKLDLSDFYVRERPKTNEHIKQIINSFQKFERYWCDVLNDGVLDRREFGTDVWSSEEFIPTMTLKLYYTNFDKNAERYETVQNRKIAQEMGRLCPSASVERKLENKKQSRGFILPPIEVARKDFEKAIKSKIDWDD